MNVKKELNKKSYKERKREVNGKGNNKRKSAREKKRNQGTNKEEKGVKER